MSISYYTPNTSSNLNWLYEHAQLSVSAIQANGGKYLRVNDNTDVLEWATKNTANSIVELNSLAKVPDSLLPSFVNDVRIYATLTALQTAEPTGEQGVIYLTEDNGYSYRWTGSVYFNVSTQGFYSKSELDTAFNDKLNLSGGTLTGLLNLGGQNLTNASTVSGTTANFTNIGATTATGTNANFTNVGAFTATGTINMNNNTIINTSGISTGSTRQYQINSQNNDTRSVYFEDTTTFFDKQTNHNGNNIIGVGTLTTANANITTANITTANITTANNTTSNLGILGSNVNGNSKNITAINELTAFRPIIYEIYAFNGGGRHVYFDGGTTFHNKPQHCGNNTITDISTASGTTANFTNIGAFTSSGNINMNNNNISGIATATGTTASFANNSGFTATGAINMNNNGIAGISTLNGQTMTGFINIGQMIFSITNPNGQTGVRNYVVGSASNAINPLWFGGASVYIRPSGLGQTIFRSVPEYGPTFLNATPAQNWELRFDATTDNMTLHVPDISRLSDFFNIDNELYCKIFYNLV